MINHECIIGLLYYIDSCDLVTVSKLKQHIRERIEDNILNDKYYSLPYLKNKEWLLSDYADKRKSTNLKRFDFCPYCGEKIDWEKIKNGK